MGKLSKGSKQYNFESHNFVKFSFTNIWDLHLNLVECESFLKSNSPEILPLCETNLDDSIDFGNFSLRGNFSLNLSLIWKDSITPMHGLAVYVKVGLPFASRKLCRFLFVILTDFTSLSVLLRFLLLINFFVSVHGFWFYFI